MDTHHFGRALGQTLRGGDVLALYGELGSGKTQFVKGVAEGLGIPPSDITSPTFALIHEHTGRLPLYHVDLYRLEHPRDVNAIGLEEYLEGDGVTAVEWAERAEHLLPHHRIEVRLSHKGGRHRQVTIDRPPSKSRSTP